jgi:hypothetical protein
MLSADVSRETFVLIAIMFIGRPHFTRPPPPAILRDRRSAAIMVKN